MREQDGAAMIPEGRDRLRQRAEPLVTLRAFVARHTVAARLFAWIVVVAVLIGGRVLAQAVNAPSAPAPLTYRAAVARALDVNPTIRAARARRAIDLASRDVAAERLNPEFRAEFEKETPKESYTFTMPWETGGKRAGRIAVANAVIAAGDAELGAVIAQVEADVRRAYFDRVVAERRQTLLNDMLILAQRVRDTAQTRFDAGDAARLEVVQTDLALADARNQATAAGGAVAAARARLNALLGFALDAPTPVDAALDIGPALPLDAALARAREHSTALALLDRQIDAQRARITLAQAMQRPDITPEATLTHRAEPEFSYGWRAAVAVSIPIFTTHKAGVAVEEATLAQLTSEREATVARITGAVAAASALAETQRQQYLRYRDDLVPQALDVERMADDAYRLGQTNLAAYLQTLQSTRDIRLRALQAAADFETALADLEQAMGAPLAATSAPGTTP
jgi:cobalt-zinc-cadmium efflux system outer membrane protein